jgi:3-oxoacyl-[acyl-carrier protein] reductase
VKVELDGRVALVTGFSGRGIGRSIAFALAREGASIAGSYRSNEARASETARAIEREFGRSCAVIQTDLSDPAQADALARRAREAFGRVDILVCSAGGDWVPRDLPDIPIEHLRKVLAEEVESTFALIRAVLPEMRERRWGRIVLIGGHHADDWPFGPPEAPLDYPLGKAARHWLARVLGPRERAHGVTVNAVAPGPIEYIGLEEALRLARAERSGSRPTPADVADVVATLCSERASAVSGAVIPVPGVRPV